ncbi:hypothetical protein [Bermanella sp. R86510]|uniref:hypothetical protein n=1 Tax=unclassified Bermanella TaxID=2627862 RepID=UPI0037C7C057
MKKAINLLTLVCSMLGATLIHADNLVYNVPYYCALDSIYEGQLNISYDHEMNSDISFDYRYYSLKGPDHVIIDKQNNYQISSHAIGAYFEFFSSAKYYLGSVEHQLNNNARMPIKFDHYGPAVVWFVRRSRQNHCLAKEVVVQKAPTIETISSPTVRGNTISLSDIDYMFDGTFSRAALDKNSNAKVTLYAMGVGGETYRGSITVDKPADNIDSLSMIAQNSGTYAVSVEVYDGTFTKSIYVGQVKTTGGNDLPRPCPTCMPY